MMQRIFKTDYENLVHVYLHGQSFVEFIGKKKSVKVAMNVPRNREKAVIVLQETDNTVFGTVPMVGGKPIVI
jgi:hypothetical protein